MNSKLNLGRLLTIGTIVTVAMMLDGDVVASADEQITMMLDRDVVASADERVASKALIGPRQQHPRVKPNKTSNLHLIDFSFKRMIDDNRNTGAITRTNHRVISHASGECLVTPEFGKAAARNKLILDSFARIMQ